MTAAAITAAPTTDASTTDASTTAPAPTSAARPPAAVRARVGHRPVLALCRLRSSWLSVRLARLRGDRRDAGMTTAEYAVGTVAACAFAAILYRVVTSGTVSGALSELLERALHAV